MEIEFRIKRVINDEEFVRKLAILSSSSEETIRNMLQYNIISVKQMSFLSRLTVSTLEGLLKGRKKNTQFISKLTLVNPFPVGNQDGFRFVLRDEKFDKVLNKSLRNLKFS